MPHPPSIWDGVLRRLQSELPAFALDAWILPAGGPREGPWARAPRAERLPPRSRRDALSRVDRAPARAPRRARRCRSSSRWAGASRPADAGGAASARPARRRVGALPAPRASERGAARGASKRLAAASLLAVHVRRPSWSGRATRSPARRRSPSRAGDASAPAPSTSPRRRATARPTSRGPCARELPLPGPRGLHLGRGLHHRAAARASAAATPRPSSAASARAATCWCVEDVQFFARKVATQLELFHTLEHLRAVGHAGGAHRRPAARATSRTSTPRSASRMASGLVAEIEPPDASLRRAILRAKAAAGGRAPARGLPRAPRRGGARAACATSRAC